MVEGSLPEDLRARLDLERTRAIVEYLARRMGCGDGNWQLEFRLTSGCLRHATRSHGPFGDVELEQVAHPPV